MPGFIPLSLESLLKWWLRNEIGCKPTTIKIVGEAASVEEILNKFQDNRKQMEEW